MQFLFVNAQAQFCGERVRITVCKNILNTSFSGMMGPVKNGRTRRYPINARSNIFLILLAVSKSIIKYYTDLLKAII